MPGTPTPTGLAIEQLERKLPEVFPALADRNALIALLRGLGSKEVRLALCAQLIRRPLATEVSQQEPPPVPAPVKGFAGLRIVCLDDNPASLDDLVTRFEDLGASVKVYADPIEADREFRRRRPDAVISDITRGEDPVAGFEHIARLRASGYDGPVVFFTGRVTPERRERATELGALDIVTDERAVISALREIAQFPPLSQ